MDLFPEFENQGLQLSIPKAEKNLRYHTNNYQKRAEAWRAKIILKLPQKLAWNSKKGGWENPGSQPPLKKWWFLLDDDKPLLR